MPRKLKSQDGNPYEVIRGMWEGAYVSNFVRLFQKKFGFSCLTTQDIEEALVEEESITLADIFARLLRYVTGNINILIANFDSFLRNLLINEKADVPHFLDNGIVWQELTPEEKLTTLKWLVDYVYQEKVEDIADFLDENYNADDLRGICAGQDAFNNVYWYLDDLRLYREFSHKKQSRRDWECVCLTLSDWHSFIKQFRKTSNLQEKQLYSYLNFELFPIVELELLQEKTHLNKEDIIKSVIRRERQDLDDMLEEKTLLECNNITAPDLSDTDSLSLEKQNTAIASLKFSSAKENELSDFLQNNEECEKSSDMSNRDDNLNLDESVCSIHSNLDEYKMDIKSSSEPDMCAHSSSCAAKGSDNQDGDISNNANSPGKNTNVSPSAATTTPSLPDNNQEVSLQQPLSDIPSDSSSVTSNKENAPPSSSNISNDIPPMSAISNMLGSTSEPSTTVSVQPLPSNMVNKTSFQMEPQYMQQQSQVFVFSTALANKAAESYLSGHFPSLIAYHCSQPGTKSFLEKYPLKVQQFNRQNPAAWLNTLAQMKQTGRQMKSHVNQFPGPQNMTNRFPGPSVPSATSPCSGFCNMHSSGTFSTQRGPPPWASTCGGTNMSSMGNDMCSQQWMSQQFPPGASSSIGHRFPLSQGVKVPDENLTPQQRQHREEQLAMIRKMQQMLFPEQQQHMEAVQSGMPQHNLPPRFGASEMCSHPGMDTCYNSHQPCMGDHELPPNLCDMFPGNSMMSSGFPHQEFPPNSVSAQMEWQKLQHQFYEERRKKQVCPNVPISHLSIESEISPVSSQPLQNQQQSVSQPSTPQQQQSINSPSMGLSPGTRMQGPPPPYHQANRRTMPSPHPASPNTSSLSLPSPHMASGLSSPADTSRQFPIPTPPGQRLPHPSPGPTTPVGSSSLHTTPLNSPKPATNGSQSNNGTLSRTPTTPSSTAFTPTSTPNSSCVTLSNSGPATPTSLGTSNRKQGLSCNSDLQDSNSVGSTTINTEFGSSCSLTTTNNVQGEIFCHNMQSCNQTASKDNCGSNHNEPSLMPVPSPQQIQYLNAFDGQELTIQKQPNTSIRELDIMSPASIPPSMVMSTGSHSQYQSPEAASFPNTPGSCPSVLENSQDSLSSGYPLSAPINMDGNMQRFTGFDPGPRHMVPHGPTNEVIYPKLPGVSNLEMIRMPGPMNQNSLMECNGRYPGLQNHIFGPGPSNNVTRFPMTTSDTMQRFRGPSPHTSSMDIMHSRFMRSSPHIPCVDNISQNLQLNSIVSDTIPLMPSQSFPSAGQTITSSSSSPSAGSNFMADGPQCHLQNLQKMTPPFENVPVAKISPDGMPPIEQCSNSSVNGSNMNMASFDASNSLASTSQVGPSQRLSHFDPIASMTAMSESTVSLATVAGNSQTTPNMITSNMSMSNLQMTGNTVGINQTNINFHGSIPPIQSSGACSISNPRPFNMQNQMPQNTECGLQANTYASATMPVSHMQNATKPVTYNSCTQDLNLNSQTMYVGCPADGANTISCSVTTNDPIVHTSVTTRPNSNISIPGSRHGVPNFPGQLNIQRSSVPNAGSPTMMSRGHPFNPNIHVKAGAPNTIQYLPARQQSPSSGPIRGSTIEFLQRFAAPLTNLDNKVPTHNLQYFPNSGGSHPPGVHGSINVNSGPVNVASSMMNGPRPVNMMMGPMLRGTNPKVSHPGNQMFSVGASLPNSDSLMFSRPPCPSNSMIPINTMGGGQNIAMFSNKQMPLPMGGLAPDATQPLPPSLGQSFNYKQSPFYGPTTADPNYAVQFHNFQQQLYATNTRGSQLSSQNNITGQGFFGNK